MFKKLKKYICKAIISLLLCFISLPSTPQSRVEICVNKNVELVMAMQVLSDMDSLLLSNGISGFPLTTTLNFSLKNDYMATFSPYMRSISIQYFNDIITKGFIFGRPLTTALLSDEDFRLTNTCWIESLPSPPYPANYRLLVERFLEHAYHFKEISGFDAFFNARRLIYDSLVIAQQNKVPLEPLVGNIEKFFGRKLPGYHVVLVPLMWPGGMSLSSKEPCAAKYGETWILLGPKQVVNGLPDFGTIDEYSSVVVHEFCHAFIAPLCDSYKEGIMHYKGLYAPEQKVFKRNGIPDWFDATNELLTRAAEILISSDGDPDKTKKKLQYQSENLGFRYLPTLVNAMDEYFIRQRKSFEEAFPEIIKSLAEFSQVSPK